jgi:quinohemoprotein ethanol dehydrogenase
LGASTPYTVPKLELLPATVVSDAFTPGQVALGEKIYGATCAVCHGPTARSSGVVPDLRRSGVLADKSTWNSVVIGGALKTNGMIGFSQWLNNDDAEAVRAYVASRAKHLAIAGN